MIKAVRSHPDLPSMGRLSSRSLTPQPEVLDFKQTTTSSKLRAPLPRNRTNSFEVINCRFRASGCAVRLPRDQMNAHLRNNAALHSLLLLGRIDQQQREKQKLSARMLALEKSVIAITEFLATLEEEGSLNFRPDPVVEEENLETATAASKTGTGNGEGVNAKEEPINSNAHSETTVKKPMKIDSEENKKTGLNPISTDAKNAVSLYRKPVKLLERISGRSSMRPKLSLADIVRNLHTELARAKMTPEVKPRMDIFNGPDVSLELLSGPNEACESHMMAASLVSSSMSLGSSVSRSLGGLASQAGRDPRESQGKLLSSTARKAPILPRRVSSAPAQEMETTIGKLGSSEGAKGASSGSVSGAVRGILSDGKRNGNANGNETEVGRTLGLLGAMSSRMNAQFGPNSNSLSLSGQSLGDSKGYQKSMPVSMQLHVGGSSAASGSGASTLTGVESDRDGKGSDRASASASASASALSAAQTGSSSGDDSEDIQVEIQIHNPNHMSLSHNGDGSFSQPSDDTDQWNSSAMAIVPGRRAMGAMGGMGGILEAATGGSAGAVGSHTVRRGISNRYAGIDIDRAILEADDPDLGAHHNGNDLKQAARTDRDADRDRDRKRRRDRALNRERDRTPRNDSSDLQHRERNRGSGVGHGLGHRLGSFDDHARPVDDDIDGQDRDRTAETLAQMSELCASISPRYVPKQRPGSSASRHQRSTRDTPRERDRERDREVVQVPLRTSSRQRKRPRRSISFDKNDKHSSTTPRSFTDQAPGSGVVRATARSTRPRRESSRTSSGESRSRKGRKNTKLGIDQASFRLQTQAAARRVQQLMDEDGKLISRKRKSRNRTLKQKFGLNAFEAPKKPKTAYNYYQIGVRESILKELLKESGGHIGSKEVQSQKIARVIGERWKAMPEHERQIFNNLAAKDKERYKRELDDYVRLNKQLEQSRKLQTSASKSSKEVLPGA
ncbi:hypothetical protein AAMO2058_000359400 [Amorphochlora amoebiformis]